MSDPGIKHLSGTESAIASDPNAASGLGIAARLYVRDHAHNQYVLPYKLGREWKQFKHFLEEIYTRRGGGEHLEHIRNEELDVKVATSRGYDVVLPSLWDVVIVPEAHIRIAFWSAGNADAQAKSSRFHDSRDRGVGFANDESNSSEDEWANIDAMQPPPPPPRARPSDREESANEEEEDEDEDEDEDENEEEELTDEEKEEGSEPSPVSNLVRNALTPNDQAGNDLSFAVDTRWVGVHSSAGKVSEGSSDISNKPFDGHGMNVNSLNITKALTVTADDRTAVQVHTLPGPENSIYSSSIGIRWYHVHAELLDWAQFKSTCLSVPSLSDRLREVIMKTLMKIEKDSLKTFQTGMFIEPGTVLRGDDASKTEPSSVIFSCIPHFDVRRPLRATAAQSDRLHPPRTLMQSYYPKYPYEPVRDRDDEQAFRKIGNAHNDNLIHIPSIWMLNINSNIVVTAGYRPLSSEFVKSIEVQEEELKYLTSSVEDNTLTAVRLTDLGGRVLLFKLQEIRSYFEVEQRLRELRMLPGNRSDAGLQVAWKPPDGVDRKIGPHNWPRLLQQKNLFIDLSVVDEKIKEDMNESPPQEIQQIQPLGFPDNSVPPFFDWPNTSKDGESLLGVTTATTNRSLHCLDLVERKMKTECLPSYETLGPVDETFTSTKYYDSLSTKTSKDILANALFEVGGMSSSKAAPLYETFHQSIIKSKRIGLEEEIKSFVSIVHETLKLFVSDVDHTTMLRKVWGAMSKLLDATERLSNTEPCAPDFQEYLDPVWKGPLTGKRSWRIRIPSPPFSGLDASKPSIALPESDGRLVQSLRKCKRCKWRTPFNDPNDALEHLRGHISRISRSAGEPHDAKLTPLLETDRLKDWIRNDDQGIIELGLAKAVLILEQGTLAARSILDQLKEVVDGVRKEDGHKSDLYTFPEKLLETLHRLIVFYLAVERSLHFTEEGFNILEKDKRGEKFPNNWNRIVIALERFSDDVRRPLSKARVDLCRMASSSNPNDYWKRMSLGPQYISTWFMRRLIVQPLDKGKTVADLYRDYLSTLQFQVNHRPGKRLLRSINLLKEELHILSEVNNWQTRLVENYLSVLNDETYPTDIPSRRALFPRERLVLESCLENLASTQEDYAEQIQRCGPLIESTKQSAEINEEDHGKAILVFTVVTIIFLPLSFVTSFLGMNTSDIRDMNNTQALFWEIAIPLTAMVLGTITFVAYNGDELRDRFSASYRILTGKRKHATKRYSDSSTTLDYKSIADEAEYATPKLDNWPWNETHDISFPTDHTIPEYHRRQRTNLNPYTHRTRVIPEEYALEDELDELRLGGPKERLPSHGPPPLAARVHVENRSARPRPPRHLPLNHYGRTPEFVKPYGYQPGYKPNVPSYMRINRARILPETLAYYGLPWEFDSQDIDYILVKVELSHSEMEVLYEHTRRLKQSWAEVEEGPWYGGGRRHRVGGNRRPHDDDDEWDDVDGGVGRGEYTWVKKGAKGRRRGPELVHSWYN